MIVRCPRCHGKAIQYLYNYEYDYSIYYCPSLRCKVRNFIVKDNEVIHINYYKNLSSKHRALYRSIRDKLRNCSRTYRKIVMSKYKKLKERC